MSFSVKERRSSTLFQYEGELYKLEGQIDVVDGAAHNINSNVYDMADGAYMGSIGDTITGNIIVNINTRSKASDVCLMYESVKSEILALAK